MEDFVALSSSKYSKEPGSAKGQNAEIRLPIVILNAVKGQQQKYSDSSLRSRMMAKGKGNDERQPQIPFGDDTKKDNGNGNRNDEGSGNDRMGREQRTRTRIGGKRCFILL